MKRFLTFALVLSLVFCSVPLTAYADDSNYSNYLPWDDCSFTQKVNNLMEAVTKSVGVVLVDRDWSKSMNLATEFVNYMNGNVSGDTDDEKAQSILDALNGKFSVITKNQKQQIRLSAELLKDYKTFMKQYIQDKETPLYYTMHIPSIDQLYPSNVGYTYVYNQIKEAVSEFGFIYVDAYNSNFVYFYDLSNYIDTSFFTVNNLSSNNPVNYIKCMSATHRFISSESQISDTPRYGILFDDDKSIIKDIKNNYSSLSKQFHYYFLDGLDVAQSKLSEPSSAFPNGSSYVCFAVASKDMYVKVWSTLKDYQNSLAGKVQRNVYYSSVYYNNTYNDTDVDLETLYKYMDNLTDIISKLQTEEKENNYDEDALTRRLDALINAIWSSTGEIADDTGTIVEQNKKTNTWLEKIYDKVSDIKKSIVKDTSVTESWDKQIDNLVSNSNNSTVLNVFFMDLSDAFTPLAEKSKTKFPFSLPWDMYFVATLLYAEPQAPVYTLPLKLESFGIDTELIIDCNHISLLASVSRVMLTLLYMLSLIRLTFKVISLHEGETADA